MSVNSWAEALDELEQRLDTADAALGRDDEFDSVPPFVPPEVEGLLPAALVDRATALVTRGAQLEHRYRGAVDRLRVELARMPRGTGRPAGLVPRRFDFDA